MSLPFPPACLPLLLGSLPQRAAAQALELSRRYAGALLAWPQLPRRSFREQNLIQSTIGFPGLVIDAARAHVYVNREMALDGLDRLALAYLENDTSYAALAPDDAAGFTELLRQSESLKGARALKGQLMGPISVAAQLTDDNQRPLIYDDILFDALAQHLRLRAAWQEQHLRELADTTIICLNEPFLDVVGQPFLPLEWDRARSQIEIVFEGITGCKGIYAGGAINWAQLLQTSADLLIADVYNYSHSLAATGSTLQSFLEHDGIIGLGLVPTDEDALSRSTAETLVRRIESLFVDLEAAGIERTLLLNRAVISTSGSLSILEPASAERALQLVADVSKLLREIYALS